MSIRSRKLSIVLGLVLLGAMAGSLVATAMFLLGAASQGPVGIADLRVATIVGSSFGGLIGASVAPALGFGILRHVPIGRAIFWLTVWPIAAGAVGAATKTPLVLLFTLLALLVGPYLAKRTR